MKDLDAMNRAQLEEELQRVTEESRELPFEEALPYLDVSRYDEIQRTIAALDRMAAPVKSYLLCADTAHEFNEDAHNRDLAAPLVCSRCGANWDDLYDELSGRLQ